MNSDHCSWAFVSKPGNSTYAKPVLHPGQQSKRSPGLLRWEHCGVMQLAGSPPAACCWAWTCRTNDTSASQNQMMRISYFLLCCMAAQGRHEAQSHTSGAWSSAHWGRLIPEKSWSPPCLAVPFCSCYCGYCVFPREEHTEAPNFAQTTDYAALLCLFFLAFSFLTCP